MRKNYIVPVKNPFFVIHKDFFTHMYRFDNYDEVNFHFHEENCFEITFVCSGHGYHHADSSVTNVKNGDVVITTPNTVHSFEPVDKSNSGDLEVFDVLFHIDFIKDSNIEFLDEAINFLLEKNRLFSLDDTVAIRNKMFEIVHEFSFKSEGYMSLLKTLLQQYIMILYRAYLLKKNPKIGKNSEIVKKAISFIHENFEKPISLSDVCSHCFVSKSYLCSVFKSATGNGVNQFINKHRISQSTGFLIATDEKISEVCKKVGFNDPVFFSKSFKKQMGITPNEYRKKYSPTII